MMVMGEGDEKMQVASHLVMATCCSFNHPAFTIHGLSWRSVMAFAQTPGSDASLDHAHMALHIQPTPEQQQRSLQQKAKKGKEKETGKTHHPIQSRIPLLIQLNPSTSSLMPQQP